MEVVETWLFGDTASEVIKLSLSNFIIIFKWVIINRYTVFCNDGRFWARWHSMLPSGLNGTRCYLGAKWHSMLPSGRNGSRFYLRGEMALDVTFGAKWHSAKWERATWDDTGLTSWYLTPTQPWRAHRGETKFITQCASEGLIHCIMIHVTLGVKP